MGQRGRIPYNKTSAAGVIARAGRAHENAHEMTAAATKGRLGKYTALALQKNPHLEPLEAARAGRLLLRAEMLCLARRSADARAGRNAGQEPPV